MYCLNVYAYILMFCINVYAYIHTHLFIFCFSFNFLFISAQETELFKLLNNKTQFLRMFHIYHFSISYNIQKTLDVLKFFYKFRTLQVLRIYDVVSMYKN